MKAIFLSIGPRSTLSGNPFARAITRDKPTTTPLTTLIDDYFGQVSRALIGGPTGPEAFTLLLRLLSSPFNHTDTGASYTRLYNSGMSNGGLPFAILAGHFEGWCRQRRGLSMFCFGGGSDSS